MTEDAYELHPIGWVESSLVDPDAAPKQGDEGAPDADLMFNSDVAEGIKDLHVGEELIVLTWLHRARQTYWPCVPVTTTATRCMVYSARELPTVRTRSGFIAL